MIFDASANGAGVTSGVGIMGDQGSGVLTGAATFARSSTVATFTRTAHGLRVGDYAKPHTYTALTGSGVLGYTADSDGTTAFSNGNLRVMTVPTANTFTCTVTNTGPTAGTVRLFVTRAFRLHDVRYDEHRIQMPAETGSPYVTGNPAFSLFTKGMVCVMSMLVGTIAQMWTTDGFALGGTRDAPGIRIGGGSATPTAAWPDGSLYLKTNGTIYQRRSGVWVLLAI